MSPLARRSVSVALILLLLAVPSQAQIPDPVETSLLAKIAAALKATLTPADKERIARAQAGDGDWRRPHMNLWR